MYLFMMHATRNRAGQGQSPQDFANIVFLTVHYRCVDDVQTAVQTATLKHFSQLSVVTEF